MAISVPDTPKTKTKIYENFKGCDYTNDSTNVWYRRSPSGVNMLPDASGRPFKRKGWEVVKSKEDFQTILAQEGKPTEPFAINKCYYFTIDYEYMIIFTTLGVFSFKEDLLTFLSNDSAIVQSYDRAFFFEGNGKSALYIYGGNKVWLFDGTFSEVTQNLTGLETESYAEEVYIPRILIGTDASSGAGTVFEGYNMLGGEVRVDYSNNLICFAETDAEDVTVSVAEGTFATQTVSRPNDYVFTKSASGWELNGTSVTLSDYGISCLEKNPTSHPIETGDTITVHYCYGVMLPQKVASSSISNVKAFGSTVKQYDTEVTVISTGTPTTGQAKLITTGDFSWLKFADGFAPVVEGEDCVRIYYPSVLVTTDTYTDLVISVSGATLDRGAI